METIAFTTQVFREGEMFVAYSPEFDLSSCGHSLDEARKNLKEALVGFLESARERGTLQEIMSEAGYEMDVSKKQWNAPDFLMFEKSNVSLQNV